MDATWGDVAWGLVLVAFGLLAWLGQTINWLAPAAAVRLGLTEGEDAVERTFWADARGEAAWDAFTLWTMPVAGILLIIGSGAWPQLALVAGGVYLYFAGRGITTRVLMRREGLRIGSERDVRIGLVMLATWGAIALGTIVAAIVELD